MKPELAFKQSTRLERHGMAFQDAINRSLGYNIPDAGFFGGPARLPMEPGPVDPPILTGGYPYPSPAPSAIPMGPADYWTRMDPGMGYLNPSLTINPGDGSGGNGGPAGYNYPAPGTGATDPSRGNVLSNIFGSTPAGALIKLLTGNASQIPAVRLAQTIGNLFKHQPDWRQNAASNQGNGPADAASSPSTGSAGSPPTGGAGNWANSLPAVSGFYGNMGFAPYGGGYISQFLDTLQKQG